MIGANGLSIVFVHGIEANGYDEEIHANDTWTHQNGTFWPQLLLPQLLPSARIILFKYNPYFIGHSGIRTFQDLQRSLLKKTVEIRRKQKEVHRPVVFIAHSLGGIVVKMTLKEAEHDPQYSCLNASIYGIVCFATPREGSNTDIVEVAERIRSLMTEELLLSLHTFLNTTFLREISRDFAKLSDHQHNLEILAFYEQRTIEYDVWVKHESDVRYEGSTRGMLVRRRKAMFVALLIWASMMSMRRQHHPRLHTRLRYDWIAITLIYASSLGWKIPNISLLQRIWSVW